jgi:hypothetical protein
MGEFDKGGKNMKKIFALILAVLVLMGTAACAKEEKTETVDAPLADVMAEILEGADLEFAVDNMPVEKERFSWYFGIDYFEGAEGYSAESLIGSIPHSLALLRVPEGEDAAAIASEIEQKIDPRKWICVEAEKTIVKQRGNLILVIMTFADQADQFAQAFDNYFEK